MKDVKLRKMLKDLMPEGLNNFFPLAKAKIEDGSERYKELLLIEGQFKKTEQENRSGTLSKQEYDLSLNKIRKNILSLIDEITEKDVASDLTDRKTVQQYRESKDEFQEKLKLFGQKRKLASSEGMQIYDREFRTFTNELKSTITSYGKIAYVDTQSKRLDRGMGIMLMIGNVTISVIPCSDDSKKFMWLSLQFNKEGSKKSSKKLDAFTLDYAESGELVWRNKPGEQELIFSSKELAELIAREVFEWVIK